MSDDSLHYFKLKALKQKRNRYIQKIQIEETKMLRDIDTARQKRSVWPERICLELNSALPLKNSEVALLS